MSTSSALHNLLVELLRRPELSDVHLEELQVPWLREGGVLAPSNLTAITRVDLQALIEQNEAESGVRWTELEDRLAKRGDIDIGFSIGSHRVRGNLYRANNRRLCLALRRIPAVPNDWSKLGLPVMLRQLLNRSKGLVLVTGPTGAGKSSTLAAIIEFLNTEHARHIVTIEDPIEYVFEQKKSLIQQRQVGRDAASFPLALRAALREDPDVIMIGELRDAETIETALHAANTGHLVLGTLHTAGARQAVQRIELVFAEHARAGAMQTLSSVLIAVLSQVLIPRAKGPGRVLGYELLVNNDATRQSIKDSKVNNLFSALELGRRDGQVLLNRNLAERIRAGDISREDGLYFSYDPVALDKELANGRA
jgi:twitching motility protein PilT